ncbi:Pkinase-domain-containing protein [Phlegmacium glaucopus]|nr:Pkinase-domain-containing protein [Phlegmacium glaucopus]
MYPSQINHQIPNNSQQIQHQRQQQQQDSVSVQGIPSITIQDNHLLIGTSQSSSTRSYTRLKVLGDGSFGTVWLCDWHGILPPNTPLSPMQRGAGARPEWAGKRLVAVKRMKKKWEGGWDECQKLKELESLRAIPFHPNVIPLYDFFLLPDSKELYFVFESMEGNLYHLIKTRKGRALAGGLVSSIFRQIVSGLDHIHAHGYFHRDMKPENVLVTTTGLFDYTSVSPIAPPNAPKEKDVVAIIKLADFGLARETKSPPPYTEYVATRWYRAPEVLLLSRDYSNPVDMWALGTIMAELVNLRPLFPGSDQLDQVYRICEILGDPSDAYGLDMHGSRIGGGPWIKGDKLAKAVGFQFPKSEPKNFEALFDRTVPRSLVQCIRDLLRYDPDTRLTSRACLNHPYLQETVPRNHITFPTGIHTASNSSIPTMPAYVNGSYPHSTSPSSSRVLPPSHSPHHLHHPPQFPEASTTHRVPYPTSHSQPPLAPPQNSYMLDDRRPHLNGAWSERPADYMDISSSHKQPQLYVNGHPPNMHDSPMVQDPVRQPESHPDANNTQASLPIQTNKLGKLGSLTFGKKPNRWVLSGMFGGDKSHQNSLPPVDETSPVSFPSRKRANSSSTGNRSTGDLSPVRDQQPLTQDLRDMKKINKKEAERLHQEAEKAKRKLAALKHREQARDVIHKRKQLTRKTVHDDIEWIGIGNEQRTNLGEPKGKHPSSGVRHDFNTGGNATLSATVNAAAGKFGPQHEHLHVAHDWDTERDCRGEERITKARRREFDDDHSMSSSDVHSISRMSSISFATVDSDPGPSRIRNRPSLFGISRVTSKSSLRTSFDDFSPSARSSNSFSLEGQLAHDFRTQASVTSHISGSVSPPPLQMLSLSPTMSPPLSPSSPWLQVQHHKENLLSRTQSSPYLSVSPHHLRPDDPSQSPLDLNAQLPPLPPSPYSHRPRTYGYPPSSGRTPKSAKSAINPIFKVVSYKWDSTDGLVPDDSIQPAPPPPPPPIPPLPPSMETCLLSSNTLPPFCQLEAVAGGEYTSLSPMVFTAPEDR